MQGHQLFQAKSFLMVALLTFATISPACAQEKPKRMIPGASATELVPESPDEKDGIAQIIIGRLFKSGNTEWTRIGSSGLKDSPPLPTGFVLYKNLAFRIKTEAIISNSQLTVFRVLSADNEAEFDKLNILHLEDDEMSPAGSSWMPVTVVPEVWDEHFHRVSKARYDALKPDFNLRRLAAISDKFGIFAIALGPASETESNGPFTQFEVTPSSSPVPVTVGEEVIHTILVKNKGPGAAAEVNLKVDLDADFGYAAKSSQGSCHQSNQSTGRTLCYLGAMPPGSIATITVVGRVSRNVVLTKEVSEFGNMLEIVFKANPTDLVTSDEQLFMQFNFKILKKP